MDQTTSTQFYQHNGYLPNIPILTGPEIVDLLANLRAFINEYGNDDRFGEWCYFKSHLILPWVVNLARHPKIIEAASAILGPDLLLWNSFVPCKPPQSDGLFDWHQDATYWQIVPSDKVITLWLAAGDVTTNNGGMRIIQGSHLQGQLSHEMTFDPKSMLRRGQRITDPFYDDAAICGDLRAGEASIHHPLTIHGSGPNTSDTWRYAVSFNIVSADVKPHPDFPESALFLSGENRNQHFDKETPPDGILSKAALAEYQRTKCIAAARYSDAM